jgi:hypothetical protein
MKSALGSYEIVPKQTKPVNLALQLRPVHLNSYLLLV